MKDLKKTVDLIKGRLIFKVFKFMSLQLNRRQLPTTEFSSRARSKGLSGMTLLELTVVILVLLSLIAILFIGARAWRRGSDRALCIMQIQAVQKGVRSYANLYGFANGETAPGLQAHVIGLGRFVETTPNCPGGGTYSYGATSGNNVVPPLGEIYLQCSLAGSSEHDPLNHTDW